MAAKIEILFCQTLKGGLAAAAVRYGGAPIAADEAQGIEAQELAMLAHPRRRQERLAALYVLHRVLGVRERLYHRPSGQPALQGRSAGVSISHSADGIAGAAFHPEYAAGLDIENKNRNFGGLARRFLSADEQEFINTNDLCGIAWCVKEAAYKAAGRAGISFAEHIALHPFAPHDSSIEARIALPAQTLTLTFEKIALPLHWAAAGTGRHLA